MAKTMRTAFIRVSKYNDTQNGMVEYSYDDIKNILVEWQKSKKFLYYVKDHNNEPGDSNPHYHIVCKFRDSTSFNDIKAKFPYGNIESAKNVKNCVQYLVHMNDLSKTQYDFDSIFTNDPNINKYRLISAANQLLKLDDYIHKIDSGDIREYNLTEQIPIEIFSAYKSRILNALEYYRRKVMTNPNRDITCMIFTGTTGTYKTTYAKQYAVNTNKSICISSSSNDPMQDYKGEDILLLDDLRDDAFKFHDFLKVLDNHTQSSISSRYSNKAFIGDTIIITSSQPLADWYFDISKEDKEQLYRRIKVQMQFTDTDIKCFHWNDKAHKYVYEGSVPNLNKFKPEQTKKVALDILKSMGVTLSEETEKQFRDADLSVYNDFDLGTLYDKSDEDLKKIKDNFEQLKVEDIDF